ncbi:MAG TPA: Gfo/Idh/MocA family oxidoreductase [Planctomycetota bacterium]|nr:Gfo/Idh/MocA family oxidoreductase [Planctomycetota bacterium]
MRRRTCRRVFLSSTLGGAAGLVILRDSASAQATKANDKLNVALIGVGGRGTWFVDTIPRMQNVVAFCDVNAQKIAEAFKHCAQRAADYPKSPNAWERNAAPAFARVTEDKTKVYNDFRKMIDEMGQGLDAVIVATPDHTHAVASAYAIRAGKGVFCEKPLTRLVFESRALRELARKHKVATAMGNQGTYSGAFRRALELIRNGTLGEIREVHVWNSGGGSDKTEPPKGEQPVPDYLKWDLWLGPAKMRPFHRDWLRRNAWRDFGTCQLGNWASHTANLAVMAIKTHELWLADPPKDPHPVVRIEAKTSGINRLSFPKWELIKWEVPARAEFPPITITWHNGGAPGRKELVDSIQKEITDPKQKNLDFAGTLFVGTKGRLYATGHNATFGLLPEEQFKGVQRDRPEQVEQSRGPEQDWFLACKGGKPPWSNFDYADALNEFLMLGNVATQFEGKLEYDPVDMKIVNNAEADKALRCEYREGWAL